MNKSKNILFAVYTGLLVCACAHANIYETRDANGNLVFTNVSDSRLHQKLIIADPSQKNGKNKSSPDQMNSQSKFVSPQTTNPNSVCDSAASFASAVYVGKTHGYPKSIYKGSGTNGSAEFLNGLVDSIYASDSPVNGIEAAKTTAHESCMKQFKNE